MMSGVRERLAFLELLSRGWLARVCTGMLALSLFFGRPARGEAYAVLAHEALIDSVWDTSIRPLLLKRFPQSTGEELKKAHGYAYGGAIIQDMGYYPHGSHFFSNLTHYVRSGDFIVALLQDSTDIDGYAFALGALSHYAADNDGHLIAVNRSVPLLYPLPKATRIAWSLKKDQILKDRPSMTKRTFLYNLSRASYQKNWGNKYQPPTLGERFIAFLVRILPKIGPLKVLQLRTPTPEAERMFEASFNASLLRYRKLLDNVAAGKLDLPDDNFDTGEVTGPGIYRLNDQAQAELLEALAKQGFSKASSGAWTELLEFFANPDSPNAIKSKPKEWMKVQVELEQLRKAASAVASQQILVRATVSAGKRIEHKH